MLVSHSQTAFSSFAFGREEKGSGECPSYINFVLKIPTFWGFYAWFLIGVNGQEKIAYPLKRLAVQGDYITLTNQGTFSVL